MIRFSTSSLSSVGKKIFMGLTGLLLSGFIVVHLLGNLALLSPDKDPFNKYAHFLQSLGTSIYIAEIILASIFLIHFFDAILITWGNWKARPTGYKVVTNAKGASRKSIASTTMIYTGLIIITFTVLHLFHFKYGAIVEYTTADGQNIRDLYVIVYEFFASILNVVFYVAVMVLLGFHLSHGFWSAFQSLGLSGKRFTVFIQGFAYLFAVIMAIGFVFIPIWIYFRAGGAL
ncbi:MAG: succinate dehydrogenase cytochrome b subunit [Calditrichaceae bacterium]